MYVCFEDEVQPQVEVTLRTFFVILPLIDLYIYIYAMTSRFDLGNLGFAVKNPQREEIKKLPTANSKTSNDKKLPTIENIGM